MEFNKASAEVRLEIRRGIEVEGHENRALFKLFLSFQCYLVHHTLHVSFVSFLKT